MGIRLVGAALNPAWAGLSDGARVVLIQMAYTAKDTSTSGCAAATYWAGHAPFIISVLGLDPDLMSPTELDNADRRIKRYVRELKDAGAVTLVSAASRGRHAVYSVHPDRYPEGSLSAIVAASLASVDNSSRVDLLPAEWGTSSVPHLVHQMSPITGERGTSREHKGGHPVSPLGKNVGEQEERRTTDQPTQPPTQLSRSAP